MRRPGRRPLGLRARVTLFFSVAGFALSATLATFTYLLARDYLVDQRAKVAKAQTYFNAGVVLRELYRSADRTESRSDALNRALSSVRYEPNGFAVLITDAGDKRSNPSLGNLVDQLPRELQARVATKPAAYMIHTNANDKAFVTVGVRMPGGGVTYFEGFPLADVDANLRFISRVLGLGALGTTMFGAFVGWRASRRLLRPLDRVSQAAAGIAGGGLDTRLPEESDPTLNRLTRSFNEMANTVQARIEREARFASDVSHELRSPITALTAAVEVLDGRRTDLPDRSQQALDVVVNQVRRFDQMVLDLLELSRLDAGVAELLTEDVVLPDLVKRIAQRYGFSAVPIEAAPGSARPVAVDKRRLERIVANLLDNARQHGGGPVRITVTPTRNDAGRWVELAVEDNGPGVALSERHRIFERFARGTASRHRIGTGLGLALVAEHTQAHGGNAWVEERAGGGSRFVVALPAGHR